MNRVFVFTVFVFVLALHFRALINVFFKFASVVRKGFMMAHCGYWLAFALYVTRFALYRGEYMEGFVNLFNDDGFSFLGHWMFGHNTGNGTKDSWHFNRFKAGTLDLTLTLHKPLEFETRFEVALYDDQAGSWPKLLANKSNGCWYHDNIKGLNPELPRTWEVIKFLEDKDGNDSWSGSINIHEHIKPRWWWAYLVKCDFEKTPAGDFVRNDIHYKLHWRQSDGRRWNEEISLHEEHQNTFHCITPFLTGILLVIQCWSTYLYYQKSNKFIHSLVKLLTLCLFLQFIASIFEMFYWLHLTYSGYKEFGILTFSFLFAISCNVIFLYLLTSLFAFGVRMSQSKLNKKLNYVLIAFCIMCEMFNFIVYVWNYQYYPNKESTLYRYTQYPQMCYGVFMLIIGCSFYCILLFATCKDSLNGIITKIQRNARLLFGFLLMFTWFLWPMIAVAAAKTIQISRTDFACDVISWCMKMFSLCVVIFLIHPINPFHDRCFDFGKQFIHARYVKNTGNVMFDDDISEDDDDDDNNEEQNVVQMNEIKRATVFSTKLKKKKKKNKKKSGKLFKYGGRNQIAQDSDDDDSDSSSDDDEIEVNLNNDDDDDSDDASASANHDDDDDDDENNINAGHIHPHAVSINDIKNENQTLKANED